MVWQDILGHERIVDRFRRSAARERLASTYLFVGRAGIGKRTFALALAQALLCRDSNCNLDACGSCPACQQVQARTHPDLIQISKPDDRNFIPVELFIGDREHRRREGLCHDISLTPFHGQRKVAIIDDADFLNAESANCLLKTLEEPPPDSMLILIGTSEHRQLPTILSRSQVVRFQPLSPGQLTTVLNRLQRKGEVSLEEIVASANGSVEQALLLDDQDLFGFRKQLFAQIATADPSDNGFAKTMCEFVESVSKESSLRRARLRLLADFTSQLFRHTLLTAAETDCQAEVAEQDAFAQTLISNCKLPGAAVAEIMAECIERTEDFQGQIAANLAMANIVPAWLNDLGGILRLETSTL